MEGLDLKQYLGNPPSVGRLGLVIAPRALFPSNGPSDAFNDSWLGWLGAWDACMTWALSTKTFRRYVPHHPIQSCHTIHAHAISQANILVDKGGTPRIGGLGNAFTLLNFPARGVEGRMGINRLSCACAPELTAPGASPDVTDSKPRTKASDMYAFGIVTFEVWKDTVAWYCPARSLETGSHGTATIFGDD